MANLVKEAMKAAAEKALGGKKAEVQTPVPEAAPIPATPQMQNSVLSDRIKGVRELVKGERESRMLYRVEPGRCRMWQRHNRRYADLNERNCADLIEGFRAMGRQEFPAIVREVKGEEGADYEIICGRRRHWTASFLGWKLLIEIRDLTDEEAFRLSDVENRDRMDISDYERAVDYKEAMGLYYDGLRQMARRLEVDPAWLSRYVDLAELPPEVVSAYASLTEIKVNHARELKPALDDPEKRSAVIARAVQIGQEQRSLREKQKELLDGREVIKRLMTAAVTVRRGGREPVKQYKVAGMTKPYLSVERGTNGALTLKLIPHKAVSRDELRRAFEEVVDQLYK